jgi:AcrR family transcriptional regulator
MPRKPDPNLEARILKAAHMLWKRGGEEQLTLRAVARAAGTNTPAVYRRFKDRKDIVLALLRDFQSDLAELFGATESVEDTAEAYIEYLLRRPHVYELISTHLHELSPRGKSGRRQPIRESRPNFGLLEQRLAKRLGGSPEDHTQLALALWAIAHGTAAILLSRTIPDGHEEKLRSACRTAVKALIEGEENFPERNDRLRGAGHLKQ